MVHYGAMILNKGATIQVNHTIQSRDSSGCWDPGKDLALADF